MKLTMGMALVITIVLLATILIKTTSATFRQENESRPVSITPITINSTQAFFMVSTIITVKCPIPANNTDESETQIPNQDKKCSPTQFTFDPLDEFTPSAFFSTTQESIPNDDPQPTTTTLTITTIDFSLFSTDESANVMANPLRFDLKNNAITAPLSFSSIAEDTELYFNILVSFDLTKSSIIMGSNPKFIATMTFSTSDPTTPPSLIPLEMTIPVQNQFGLIKTIAEYRHYNVVSPDFTDENDDNIRNYKTDNSSFQNVEMATQNLDNISKTAQYAREDQYFDPLAPSRIVNIHDIIPLTGLYDITIPSTTSTKIINEKGEEEDIKINFKSIEFSTNGFLHFDLVDYIGEIFRQQTITCLINNINVIPVFNFDQGPDRTTLVTFPLPLELKSLLQTNNHIMISIDCPYQVILLPRYPSMQVTSIHTNSFPYSITAQLLAENDQKELYSIASTTSLIIPTIGFPMAQDSNLTRPLSQIVIKEGYFDSTMLYCELAVLHEWNKAFGYQDLFGVFTSPNISNTGNIKTIDGGDDGDDGDDGNGDRGEDGGDGSSTTTIVNNVIIERRTTQIDYSHQATPSTTNFGMNFVQSQSDDIKLPFPLPGQSYSSGNMPLYADNVNKKSKDNGLSIYASIPLKSETVKQALINGDTSAVAQCGFGYTQQYGIKNPFIPKRMNSNSQSQQQSQQKEKTSILSTLSEQQQRQRQRLSNSPNTLLGAITGTEIPSPINTYSIMTVSQVPYIPPVASSMSFNVSDARGGIEFDLYLTNFTSPIDIGTVVLSFPSRSYVFNGDLLCNFNQVKLRGIGFNQLDGGNNNDNIQSIDKGWFDVKFDIVNIQTLFPKDIKIHINCPQTVLIPAWNNYYYVKATVPLRIAIYKPPAAKAKVLAAGTLTTAAEVDDIPRIENLIASTSTIQNLPALKSYIVIAIVLSIIGFFFALTLLLTKLCDRLIDRLHKHKVHVYVKTEGENNNNHGNGNGNDATQHLFSGYNQQQGYNQLHNMNNNNNNRPSPMQDSALAISTTNFLTSSTVAYQSIDDNLTSSQASNGGR